MELQTILIYLFLLLVLYLGSSYTVQKKSSFFLISALLIYALFFGLRASVGVDLWAYKKWYEDALIGASTYGHIEFGFRWLIDCCAALRLPFSFFLGLVAFLQLLLVYKSIRQCKESYPFLALVFMLSAVWLSYANGLRQQLAFCVFAYSIQFIANKSWIKYYLSVLIAVSLHASAIILIVIYPLYIFRDEWFMNVKLQCILLGLVLYFSNTSFVTSLAMHLEQILKVLDYDVYLNDNYDLVQTLKKGLGYVINLLISVCLILFSKDVKLYFNNTRLVNIIYDLTFFGILWRYVFFNSLIFARVNYYFAGFEYIYAALTLTYLWRRQRVKAALLTILYVLTFLAVMLKMHLNTALFMFNWQTELL